MADSNIKIVFKTLPEQYSITISNAIEYEINGINGILF